MNSGDHQNKLLLSATQWQKRPPRTSRRAGDDAMALLRRRQAEFEKNAALLEAWETIMPAGLKAQCRLDCRNGSVLVIRAMPGPYMHQLTMMQNELLDELRRCCPQSGIRTIRILPLKDDSEDA